MGAFGLSAACTLVQQGDVKWVPLVALAAWAFYKHIEVTLIMMTAQMVASAVA